MQRKDEFRIFYNHTIHPELLRMERLRRRLLALLTVSVLLLFGIFILDFYIGIPVVTFFTLLPAGAYITYLLYRVQKFRQTFKPNVINLILDFIDDSLNFGTLKYDSKKFIPKSTFRKSRLFLTAAHQYKGEDHISGKIGEMDFEMCELNVRELSPVRNRLNYVFKGVFLHSTLPYSLRGSILIWPREFRQYLTKTVRAFTYTGGAAVEEEGVLTPSFERIFMTYASRGANIKGLLSQDMQAAIVEYKEKNSKEIYLSVINKDIYIGITEPKDILEPYIFSSNVSFELVREFYADIQMLVNIVQDIDQHH
ncbi:MAG: DUF3137 domain-containing protein [Bacteroidota bacterium]